MENEIHLLKKQVSQLRMMLTVCAGLCLFIIAASFTGRQTSFDVIRARGIVIEDAEGRDRILIGAPIPASEDRVRTDSNQVRKHWAGRFGNGNQYMKWYQDYSHSAVGMVVLNEHGFDKVAIGEKLPDPNIGKRMFELSGMLWNDEQGWERGGLGVNKSENGQVRSVVGVDAPDGEAVHMVALEDGTRGLMMSGAPGHLMVGLSKAGGNWFEARGEFAGLQFFDKKGKLRWQQPVPADSLK